MQKPSQTGRRSIAVRRLPALLGLIALVCGLASTPSLAQPYPSKPIRLIVPFPPGGAVDFFTRTVQGRLGEVLGQSIIIDNRTGAGGMIGAEHVVKSAPDGYTFLVGNIAALAMNVGVYSKMPYDPARDFTPIMHTVAVNYVMVVHPAVPANSVRDLIALAKAQPGKLTYGSAGSGSAPHLAAEHLKSLAGINIVHVPYKGGGPVVTDLLAGQLTMTIGDQANLMPHVKAGKLRALAVGSLKRSTNYPDLPTIAEAGFPGYEAGAWQGVVGPAGLPADIVARVHEALMKVVSMPEIRERLNGGGLDIIASTPDEFRRVIRDEIAKWSKVAKDVGARVD